MNDLIGREPLAEIDYISVADGATLEELDKIAGGTLVSMAVRVGRTRLIDNIVLD
jgi:pantoate--beta-alanine ligase